MLQSMLQSTKQRSVLTSKSLLPSLVRSYSPVRSRIHMPPPPRGMRGRRQRLDSYEPQDVKYSYPGLNLEKPPTGNTIGDHDGIARLLEQPALVIERQIEMMNVIMVYYSSGTV